MILGRPFLATSNALINCRNGVMKISFGNLTAELNVFDISKTPIDIDDNDFGQVHLIDSLVEESFLQTCNEDPLEACLSHFGCDFDIDEFIEEQVNALLDSVPVMGTHSFQPKPVPQSLIDSPTSFHWRTTEVGPKALAK